MTSSTKTTCSSKYTPITTCNATDYQIARWMSHADIPFNHDDYPDTDQCWTWTGAKHGQRRGYGKFHLDGKSISAHKAGYLLLRGDVLPWYVLGHQCNNETCVNPWHLKAESQADNMRYCVESGRHPSQTK